MESWIRFAILALVFASFLRRIFKMSAQRRTSAPATFEKVPPSTVPTTITASQPRPRFGRKNDFRDIPPPPENPNMG